MCDEPVPCACTLARRKALLKKHIERHDQWNALASKLRAAGAVTDDEALLIYMQAEQEWDDAVHIASPDDPVKSLCGHEGRNLVDLPTFPDSWSGCWTCLTRAEKLLPKKEEREYARF